MKPSGERCGVRFLPFIDDENVTQLMKITRENLLWLSIVFYLHNLIGSYKN